MPAPNSDITKKVFFRQDIISEPISSEHYSLHAYPFNTLPLLESHLHPRFAIFNAGYKLQDMLQTRPESFFQLIDDYPSLSTIKALYGAWILPPPDVAYTDPTFINDDGDDDEGDDGGDGDGDFQIDDDDDDDGDTQTTPARIGELVVRKKRKRKATAVKPAGSSKKRKPTPAAANAFEHKYPQARKVLFKSHNLNRQLLSEATLSSLNRQFRGPAWSNERIREWSKPFLR